MNHAFQSHMVTAPVNGVTESRVVLYLALTLATASFTQSLGLTLLLPVLLTSESTASPSGIEFSVSSSLCTSSLLVIEFILFLTLQLTVTGVHVTLSLIVLWQ